MSASSSQDVSASNSLTDQTIVSLYIPINVSEETMPRLLRGLMFCLAVLHNTDEEIPTNNVSAFKLGHHPIFRLATFIYLYECGLNSVNPVAASPADAAVWFTFWNPLLKTTMDEFTAQKESICGFWTLCQTTEPTDAGVLLKRSRLYLSILTGWIVALKTKVLDVVSSEAGLQAFENDNATQLDRYRLNTAPATIQYDQLTHFWQSCWKQQLSAEIPPLDESTKYMISTLKKKLFGEQQGTRNVLNASTAEHSHDFELSIEMKSVETIAPHRTSYRFVSVVFFCVDPSFYSFFW